MTNTHADCALVRRFGDSGHATISAMIGGRTVDYPKHSGKAVCMAWALKGACNSNCKRADQHVRYSVGTNRAKLLPQSTPLLGSPSNNPASPLGKPLWLAQKALS